MRLLLLIMSFVCISSACTSNGQDTTGPRPDLTDPGVLRLKLCPPEATRETTFYVESKGFDLSEAEVYWFVNDEMVEGATSLQFASSDVRKGDRIQSRVILSGREIISNAVSLKNIQPAIVNARMVPPHPKGNDTLKAEVTGHDRDGDTITFLYEWTRDGENAGIRDTLEGPFKRGERISLRITPHDGEDCGLPIVLTTDICNTPPRILAGGVARFDNAIYRVQIEAEDPDGDPLRYSLKVGPPGMTVNPSTGLTVWDVPPEFRGQASFTITVTDGHGGEATQTLFVEINPV